MKARRLDRVNEKSLLKVVLDEANMTGPFSCDLAVVTNSGGCRTAREG